MNILFDIGHPGHVHLLRNLNVQLKQNGHNIWVTVKNLPMAKSLLDKYEIKYITIGKKKDSLFGKAISQLEYNWKVYQLVIKNKIVLGVGSSITLAHVSTLTRMSSVILDDDDDDVQHLFVKYAHPFADVIISPEALIGHRKKKGAVFYSGYHELAYLHPNIFKPDPLVLQEIGLKENDTFFILRFNAFKAHHDVGVKGMNLDQKKRLIALLETFGRVFITTERDIEPELKEYQLPVAPEKAHSLMFFAAMFLGDSQTMTSEAAVLGTPAIRMNSFVGQISYLEELQHKYHLTYGFKPNEYDCMINKIIELLEIPNLKQEFQKRRFIMLNDKIDVTAFLLWFIERYPESHHIMKENPAYQIRFM